MYPEESYSQSPSQSPEPPQPTIKNPLATTQLGEQLICEIKRHPIGMIATYVMAGFTLFVVGILVFVAMPAVITSSNHGQMMLVGALIFVVAAAIAAAFVFVANRVYWGNSWIVTSDSITQIKRISLFDKQSSQLSLGHLEDVTAEQNGIFPQMFHYGVLSAETAGAQDKFMFIFCPNPTYYAQQILDARERFRQGSGAAE